ncbi:uncharacterized protein TNCV_1030961 [Trichonephila clavipes]|nr:uncharacterized protein TNCV_1030961 [Trichonephila clavipes]
MDPTCKQGAVQAGGGSVMEWGGCSWRDIGLLKRLHTTLTGSICLSSLSDHRHLSMSIVHSDGNGKFQQDHVIPHTPRMLQRGSRSTFLNLDTSDGPPNPQT